MKKVTYICNMCHTEYGDKDATKGTVFAFYYNSAIIPNRFELRTLPADCDGHICQPCIDAILTSRRESKHIKPKSITP